MMGMLATPTQTTDKSKFTLSLRSGFDKNSTSAKQILKHLCGLATGNL